MREVTGCKLLILEPSEDYLGVAVKQPGDSVIIMNEVVSIRDIFNIQV